MNIASGALIDAVRKENIAIMTSCTENGTSKPRDSWSIESRIKTLRDNCKIVRHVQVKLFCTAALAKL